MIDRHAYLDTAPLRPGDTVAFVAPAGLGSEDSLRRGIEVYESWGLRVKVGDSVLAGHPRAKYLSASDDLRRADLVNAWRDPEVAAVVATRGGYGSMRLLDGIDWATMREHALRPDGRPKLLTGSSDITALHEAFRVHLDVPTLFSPMATNDVFTSDVIQADVRRWLLEPWRDRDIIGPAAETMVAGRASGRCTGGNVSLLAGAVGAAESRAADGILFLEDVTEDVYRLDGHLNQLSRAGLLQQARGIVLGSWQDCGPLDEVRALMEEYLVPLGVPILWEQGFGHDPDALSVPLNVDGELDLAGAAPHLRVTGAA